LIQKLELEESRQKIVEIYELPKFPSQCIHCNSKNLGLHGKQKNRNGVIQRYGCKNCGKKFRYNIGFEKLKCDSIHVTEALQLYFTGLSLRSISHFFKMMYGMNISVQAIYRWIKKYIKMIKTYLATYVPQVGDTWRCDEIYLKIKGEQKYLFAMMDDDSRFIICHFVGERKTMQFAIKLFSLAKTIAQKSPKIIITDGLHSYKIAYRKVFWTAKNPRVKHIYATFDKKTKYLNNKMERWNGFFRDREKTMKGIKKVDSVMIEGLIIYYNFIREHSVLKMTPAEYLGVKIAGNDKWKTLIQNAGMAQKTFNGEIK
jgi:transposase-like protein